VLFAAVLFSVRTSRRLRRLRAARADRVARSELPHTINAVITGRAAPSTDGPSATSVTLNLAVSQDEVGQVAEAFSTVYTPRCGWRPSRPRCASTWRGWRNAGPPHPHARHAALRLLDEFERDETDPDVLARLFVLDHIAARLRRNGENLLVLAGGEPGRGGHLRRAARGGRDRGRVGDRGFPTCARVDRSAGDRGSRRSATSCTCWPS
jgi:HAMP domain-containing protein